MSPHCPSRQSARGCCTRDRCSVGYFQLLSAQSGAAHAQEADEFCSVSNCGQPRDIHLSQLRGQPAALRSSQDWRQANSVTCPANTLASRQYLSAHCLGYSERGLLTLHGNTGTKGQLEGLKYLAKVARKVGSSGFCFHNKVSSGLWLGNSCSTAVVVICELPVIKFCFLN